MKFESKDGFKIWGNWAFLNEATYDMGKHSKSGLSRQIARNSGAWKWCCVNNAIQKYREHATNEGIKHPPVDLRVWVFDQDDEGVSGSAPMLRRTWGVYGFNSEDDVANFLLKAHPVNLIANFIVTIAKAAQPDITISINSQSVEIDEVYRTVFHELGHASHWQKVGSNYWVKYINYIITNGSDDPYGDGTGRNAEYCGVGEIWGNFIGSYFVRKEFEWEGAFPVTGSWDAPIGSLDELLDEQEDWYNPGFFRRCLDIHDASGIRDITVKDLYDCLEENINTFDKLIDKIETKTINNAQVQAAFNATDTDWP
jgi:hypothetical protein